MLLPSDRKAVALVEAAHRYDETAFDELYMLYSDGIFQYFRYRCDNDYLAEDLTSSVFLRVLEALPKFTLPGSGQALALTSWLFRIATNCLHDYHRREKRPVEPLNEWLPSPDQPSDMIERKTEYEEVRQAMVRLTGDQQQVLFLRFVQELSLDDVATITGQSVGSVKSMQHRALRSLARLLLFSSNTKES